MAKVDCIMDYYLANKANILFLMGLVYRNNEYSNFILEPKNMQGAKVGCISNIILAIKEDVVENMGDLVYESKLFLNELEKAVAAIATKDGNGYKIDNYYFESASNLVATLRNKIAHGDYEIDFDNNKIVLNVNLNKISIDINKLALFIVMALKSTFSSIKRNEYQRNILLFKIKEKNRKAPLKLKSEIKNVIRSFKCIDFSIKEKNGDVINRDIISTFELFLKYYKDTQDAEAIRKIRIFLNKHNIELKITEASIKSEQEVSTLVDLLMNSVSQNSSYEDQIKMIGLEVQRIINATYEKSNPLLSNFYNLCLLNAVEEVSSIDLNKIKNHLYEGMFYINYDNLASSAIAMFNTLFAYAFDDIFKSSNEYTGEPLNGFDYSLLDLSSIKVEKMELDINVLNSIQDKHNGLVKRVAEVKCKKEEINANLVQVTKSNNQKAINILQGLANRTDNLLSTLNASFQASTQELSVAKAFFDNNQAYLANKAIIEGIRNAIAHGNYVVKSGASIEDAKIVFSDIYEGELTFKGEVKIMDFIDVLSLNAEVVNDFIESKKMNGDIK